jgi:photosystem II stability/assembly factor-like uncharacterized protein
MYRISGVLALALVLTLPAAGGLNRWSTGGPYGGQVQFITVDPQTPNVLFAGIMGGGFYRSRNWGQSWEALAGFTSAMEAGAVHPLDHRVVFAANSQGIHRSADGGDSWDLIPASYADVNGFAFHPTNPDIVYAAGYYRIYRSTNRGLTWSIRGAVASNAQIDQIRQAPLASDTLYIATWNAGVQRSTNGGSTWSSVTPAAGTGWRVACHPTIPGRVYTSAYSSPMAFYVSTNGGGAWTKTGDTYFNELVVDPGDPDRLFFLTLHRVYTSPDGGATFEEILTPGGRSMAIEPIDPDGALYAGTIEGVKRSWTGGATWKNASSGLRAKTNCLAVSPEGSGVVYAGDDTGYLFKSTDGGESWALQSHVGSNLPFQNLALSSATTPAAIMGTINGTLYRTVNEGSTWSTVIGGSPNKYAWDIEPDPTNPLTVWATSGWPGWDYAFTGLHKSTNGGATFTPTGQFVDVNLLKVMFDPWSSLKMYVGGEDGLYKSTDGGTSWDSAMTGLTDTHVYTIASDMAFPSTLYCGTRSGGVFKSTTDGSGWTPAGLAGYFVKALTADPESRMMWAGTSDGLFYTTNAGVSWFTASAATTEADVMALDVDRRSPSRVYAATGSGVFAITKTTTPTVPVESRKGQTGNVNKSLPAQLLPASAITFLLAPNTFSSASPSNPVIVELALPGGARLSQTLADGEQGQLDLLPAGAKVHPLAVSEYAFDGPSSTYRPIDDTAAPAAVDDNAIQLFRCVEGESRIWLRITRSTSGWSPDGDENFLGFTIGVGAGVWPLNGASNWGAAGIYQQANTQLFGDLRDYDFEAAGDTFPVAVRAFYQKSGAGLTTAFSPATLDLFRLDHTLVADIAPTRLIGATITDFTQGDIDGDGREDIVSVDQAANRLYWSLAGPDGTYPVVDWRALDGAPPRTVKAGDVTGDGRPDILVADTGGTLRIYPWESLFDKSARTGSRLAPARTAALAGEPTASQVVDINQDGQKDFLYTTVTSDSLQIMFGQAFSSSTAIYSGQGPVALTTGDFNGDARPDIAVVNRDGNSVTVVRNEGGSFSAMTYATRSAQPVAVAAADFGRDGRTDLAVAQASDKSISVWHAAAGGTFAPASGQNLFFPNPPSALQAENFDGQNGPDILVGFADYYKLGLCVTDAAGTLAYAFSINTLGDMELDPVNHVTLTENDILSIAGGTTLGGICSRTGVAALDERPFNVVHLARSEDLSFSVVNLGAATALLNLELYDSGGTHKQAVTVPLASGQQYARYLTDPALFGSAADVPGRWVRGFLTEPETYGFWLANDGATLNYLDGLPLPDVRDAQTRLIFPAGLDALRQLVIINPLKDQCRLVLERLGGGSVKESKSYTIEGRGRLELNLATAFPALAAADFLQLLADRPVLGCQLFGDGSKLATLDGQTVPAAATTLYSPHVACGNLGVIYETKLTLLNATDTGTAVVVRLYGDAGQLLGTSPTLSIPARSKLHQDVAALFGLVGPATGYLTVEPQGTAPLTGSVTFGEAGSGRFLSSLPLAAGGQARCLVGHMANGSLGGTAFFTGLALLNPGAAAGQVQLTARDQNGVVLASAPVSVPAHGRSVFMLDQQLPQLTSIFGGYLTVEGLGDPAPEMIVFALFGDQALTFLSAVNAQPLP